MRITAWLMVAGLWGCGDKAVDEDTDVASGEEGGQDDTGTTGEEGGEEGGEEEGGEDDTGGTGGGDDTATPACLEDVLGLSVAVPEESGTTLRLGLEAPEDWSGTATVRFEEAGQDVVFTRTVADAESLFWGLPPDTEVEVEVVGQPASDATTTWCPPAQRITTGALPDQVFGPWKVVTDTGWEAEPLRMVVLIRTDTPGNVVLLIDQDGNELWSREVPGVWDFNKTAFAAADGQGALALAETRLNGDPSIFHYLPAVGESTEVAAPDALHHSAAPGPDGRIYGLGFDLFELYDITVVGDNLVAFDLGDETWEELWLARDVLPPPMKSTVENSVGTGVYDDETTSTWSYVNYAGIDMQSAWASGTFGASEQGAFGYHVPTGEHWVVTNDLINRGKVEVTGTELLGGNALFHQPHASWVGEDGEVLVYNRRDSGLGTTIEVLQVEPGEDEEPLSIEILSSYDCSLSEEDDIVNGRAGNVWPRDAVLGQEGGVMVVFHAKDRYIIELVSDPFAPDAASPGEIQTLRQLMPEGEIDTDWNQGGFMALYSVAELNAAELGE